ncbi:hypothetical protein BGX38DRAFT_1274170 [Terfezia claveryi]|nr:hypothetical protein BGX38DRAFT_1274170 [Terfezia claveryi]
MVKKRDVTFFENVMGHPTMEGFGLAPGYNIIGEHTTEIEDTPELMEINENEESANVLHLKDLRPSTKEMLAISLAGLRVDSPLDTTTPHEDDYISIDTMTSNISMSFVHQALREWQQERKRPKTNQEKKKEKTEGKMEEIIEQYTQKYRELRQEYGIEEDADIEKAVVEDDPKS